VWERALTGDLLCTSKGSIKSPGKPAVIIRLPCVDRYAPLVCVWKTVHRALFLPFDTAADYLTRAKADAAAPREENIGRKGQSPGGCLRHLSRAIELRCLSTSLAILSAAGASSVTLGTIVVA
jgi:hypothetical protein